MRDRWKYGSISGKKGMGVGWGCNVMGFLWNIPEKNALNSEILKYAQKITSDMKEMKIHCINHCIKLLTHLHVADHAHYLSLYLGADLFKCNRQP